MENKKKVLSLLPEGAENLTKLQALIKKNRAKIENLESQWTEHRKPLEAKSEELKAELANEYELTTRGNEDLKSVRERLSEIELQIKEKDALNKKLNLEFQKLKVGKQRSAYTKKISDILKIVAKQEKETWEVINKIKSVQKDINLLTGKLGRTYAEIDRELFLLAEMDTRLIEAYRTLTDLYQNAEEIIETILNCGVVERHSRDLLDQIEIEKAKKSAEKIIQVENDLKMMKEENSELKNKFRS